MDNATSPPGSARSTQTDAVERTYDSRSPLYPHPPISRSPSINLQPFAPPSPSPSPTRLSVPFFTRPRASTAPPRPPETLPLVSSPLAAEHSEFTSDHDPIDNTTADSDANLPQPPLPLRTPVKTSSFSRLRPRAFTTASRSAALNRPGTATSGNTVPSSPQQQAYGQRVVDLLDVIDPEVSTMSTLSDLQNSLFIPDLGSLLNRTRPLRLRRPDTATTAEEEKEEEEEVGKQKKAETDSKQDSETTTEVPSLQPSLLPKDSYHEERYMIIPKDLMDETWTDEQRAEVDDYVRHLLHSKRERAKRIMRSFFKFSSTPLGAFVTIYASLLTFWGAAWVLFLIGWINVGNRQDYFIEICDQILTALFCVVGIGLIPWRSVDTYHMVYIARYHRKSLRLYKEQNLNLPSDNNDLPLARTNDDEEEHHIGSDTDSIHTVKHVLTPKEESIFLHHQTKFSKSHTFYRPHETDTHRAFPLDLLIVVVCLLDCHSLFQISLGSVTWSINYHHQFRHTLTAVLLSFSICCNVAAGLVITIGNRKTRKKEEVERRLREALTKEAIHRKEKKKREQDRKIQNNHNKYHTHDPSLIAIPEAVHSKESMQLLRHESLTIGNNDTSTTTLKSLSEENSTAATSNNPSFIVTTHNY